MMKTITAGNRHGALLDEPTEAIRKEFGTYGKFKEKSMETNDANKGWICPRCEAVMSPTMKMCMICTESKNQKMYVGPAFGGGAKDESTKEDTKKFLTE